VRDLIRLDRLILTVLIEKFDGGPVGVDSIATAVAEESDTIITDVYESYLIQSGFVARTPRGGVVTTNGYKHIGIESFKNLPKRTSVK
jgi:Holliday junction DNA helicase RuvB